MASESLNESPLCPFVVSPTHIKELSIVNFWTTKESPKASPSNRIPGGYTGAIAVITEANSGDIVIQTGDQLLYRNEMYRFQVLLWTTGWQWTNIKYYPSGSQLWVDFDTIQFSFPSDRSDYFFKNNDSRPVISITFTWIENKKIWDYVDNKNSDQLMKFENNKHVFLVSTLGSIDEYGSIHHDLFPRYPSTWKEKPKMYGGCWQCPRLMNAVFYN